jgi:trigger factor
MNAQKSIPITIQREHSDEHEVTLTVTVDAEEMASRVENALRDHQKKAHVNGFRPGKVPLRIIQQRYGSAIRAKVMEETIDESYQAALDQEQLRPVAPGNIKDVEFTPDSPLIYKAVVSVTPDFTLAKMEHLTVEREVVTIRDVDIEQTLQELREDAGVLTPNQDEAVEGDVLECNLQELDEHGVPLIGKTYNDVKIEIGKNPFGEALDRQLLGIKNGDQRDVILKETPSAEQRTKGNQVKETRYRITVTSLKTKELPQLNDEFARSIDEKVDSLDQLKKNIQKYWEGRTARESQERFQHQLVDTVLKNNPFTLPKTMIENYLERLVENAKKSGQHDIDEEAFRQQHRPTAVWNLKWMLVRRKLAEQENLSATDQDIDDFIKQATKASGNAEQIRMTYSVPERRDELLSDLTERKVLKWLEQKAKIVERKVDTDDFYRRKSIVLPQ